MFENKVTVLISHLGMFYNKYKYVLCVSFFHEGKKYFISLCPLDETKNFYL